MQIWKIIPNFRKIYQTMDTFLQATASDILTKYKHRLYELYLIFPNKRTKIFFNKAFAELYGQAHWAVRTDTFKSFMRRQSELTELDKLALIHELFCVYVDISKEKNKDYLRDFANFYRLGELILSDFNELDNWLTAPVDIFRNIADIHEIDDRFDWLTEEQKDLLRQFWTNFRTGKQSREKEKFIQIRDILPELYSRFATRLTEKKQGYSGLIYRKIAEQFDVNTYLSGKYKKYLFIGFNALNRAEETVFRKFGESGKADFYWDTDAYYHFDEKQEAGDFLRKNFRRLNIKNYPVPSNFLKSKDISLIGVPLQVGQAKLVGSLLSEALTKYAPEDIAVVLADENLLFPVLYSVPPQIDSINVTMGFPMKATPVYSLIELYIRLLQNSKRISSGDYYYKDVLALLKHPAVDTASGGEAVLAIKKIEEAKQGHVRPGFLPDAFRKPIISLLFTRIPDEDFQNLFTENLLNILYEIFDKRTDELGQLVKTIENEFIHKAYTHIKRFADVLEQNKISLSFKLLTDLLLQSISTQQIPFTGKAQKGIQIMGVLETRNLDFKHVIILGMNEGKFPSVSMTPSFISENMRYVFGLPQIRYQDSVFAYFFYRLLQRAETISLVYNSIVNDKNAGEISRFVKQIQAESGFTVKEQLYSYDLISANTDPIIIDKDTQIMTSLSGYFAETNVSKKYLSASAINTYLDCSLQFYFRYIAGLKEPENIEEDVSHAALGTILHRAAELIYKHIIKSNHSPIIEKSDIPTAKQYIDKAVEIAFSEYYKTDSFSDFVAEGNQIIIREVVKKYLQKILDTDADYVPFEIVSLEDEKQFITTLSVKTLEGKKEVTLGGTIDRIDLKNNTIRVTDYKTGSVKKEFSGFEDLFADQTNGHNKTVVQIFLYAYMYKQKFPHRKHVQPCIYDVRGMSAANFSPDIILKVGKDSQIINPETFEMLLPDFLENLSKKIGELYNPDVPFQQADNVKVCEYCAYREICKRT